MLILFISVTRTTVASEMADEFYYFTLINIYQGFYCLIILHILCKECSI